MSGNHCDLINNFLFIIHAKTVFITCLYVLHINITVIGTFLNIRILYHLKGASTRLKGCFVLAGSGSK